MHRKASRRAVFERCRSVFIGGKGFRQRINKLYKSYKCVTIQHFYAEWQNKKEKVVVCAICGTGLRGNGSVYGKVTEFTIKYYYSSVEKAILTFGIC